MPATLDLTGDFGVYRDDEYVLRLPFFADDEPMPVDDNEFSAHVRTHRLDPGADASDPLAEFDVDMTEAADGVVTLRLSREQTAALPSVCVWDLQVDDVTWLTGQVAVTGDVTRSPSS